MSSPTSNPTQAPALASPALDPTIDTGPDEPPPWRAELVKPSLPSHLDVMIPASNRSPRWSSLPERAVERLAQGYPRRPAHPEACWPWYGTLDAAGFGRMSYEGRQQPAQRISYRFAIGPIPPCCQIVCGYGTRHCGRPSHLRVRGR